ncbi:FHA domain-containing protein [Ectothiorhodospira lacustris]|uniref:FHA domain-containing protein n=1 Tax=Ectothiorhodospira lacustris TaxID=2899127 RepID=UPI001EE965E4|nr:FHA domain-containing protein [Ectothiorhodospira lacustris]MCG5499596.1 FHA domain-containing protein [Ectothiorhodospira lacustris]MCG5508710.1 FHA domain-containing protein [Ectothiorhodospira lacustris]MCG5520501.1 FHA domain-containing protein [Ectothiorhodospira lacustris]
MAYLQAYINRRPAGEYPLQEGTTTIGRRQGNLIRLDDRSVSGHHARLRFYRGIATLHDLESTNGTFVNGEKIREATIQDGDFIIIGKYRLRFRLSRQASQQEPEAQSPDDGTYILRLATPGMPPILAGREISHQIRGTRAQAAASSSDDEHMDMAAPRVTLRILSGRNQGRHLDLLSAVNALGEPGRQVVALIRDEGQLFLQPLEAELGPPLINHRPVEGHGRHPLQQDDLLEVAGVRMVVNIEMPTR